MAVSPKCGLAFFLMGYVQLDKPISAVGGTELFADKLRISEVEETGPVFPSGWVGALAHRLH